MAAGAAPVERCGERIAPARRRLAERMIRCRDPTDDAQGRGHDHEAPQARPGSALDAKRLERYRPGLVDFTLDELAGALRPRRTGSAASTRRRELILTILTQNTADINAEDAFERAPRAPTRSSLPAGAARPRRGLGRLGLPEAPPPDWAAVEVAPIEELIDVIRPGGLANQKAPRIQAALRTIREERGDYSLEFLGEMSALEARDWLTRIDGIGKKTASVVLLFCFGLPLMPIDRHVERVAQRVGLLPAKATIDQAHDLFLALLAAGPDVRGPRQPDPPRPARLPRAAPGARAVSPPRPLPLRQPEGAVVRATAPSQRHHQSR